jgi:hypothetical protein
MFMEEVRIRSKGVTFNGLQLGESFAKVVQQVVSFGLDISESELVICTKENVAFSYDLGGIPSPPCNQGVSKWVGWAKMDGGRESARRKGVFRDFAIDGPGRVRS